MHTLHHENHAVLLSLVTLYSLKIKGKMDNVAHYPQTCGKCATHLIGPILQLFNKMR